MFSSPAFSDAHTLNITSQFLAYFDNSSMTLKDLLMQDAHEYVYALVPGLFTRWYPLYMKTIQNSFEGLGLDLRTIPVNTDFSVVREPYILVS